MSISVAPRSFLHTPHHPMKVRELRGQRAPFSISDYIILKCCNLFLQDPSIQFRWGIGRRGRNRRGTTKAPQGQIPAAQSEPGCPSPAEIWQSHPGAGQAGCCQALIFHQPPAEQSVGCSRLQDSGHTFSKRRWRGGLVWCQRAGGGRLQTIPKQ